MVLKFIINFFDMIFLIFLINIPFSKFITFIINKIYLLINQDMVRFELTVCKNIHNYSRVIL